MRRRNTITHEFVEYIPDRIENGTIYVSVTFATAVHKCFCGCGSEVITPLSPTDWRLTFDGKTISLYPSIGNWSFACKSHYWISNNRVEWAKKWSEGRINAARKQDSLNKSDYYDKGVSSSKDGEATGIMSKDPGSLWSRLKKLWS